MSKNTAEGAARLFATLTAIDRMLLDVRVEGLPWRETYAGDVTFKTDNGWTIVVFNDCDSWDYIDHAIDPAGGRVFDIAWNADDDPVETCLVHTYEADPRAWGI